MNRSIYKFDNRPKNFIASPIKNCESESNFTELSIIKYKFQSPILEKRRLSLHLIENININHCHVRSNQRVCSPKEAFRVVCEVVS